MFGMRSIRTRPPRSTAPATHVLLSRQFSPLLLAANHGLVHLDDADEGGAVEGVIAHRLSDAMAEEPCGLAGHAERPSHLLGAHALSGLAHEVNRGEPLPQRQVAQMHDRAGRDGEAMPTALAVPLAAAGHFANVCVTTLEASDPSGPADRFKRVTAPSVRVVPVQQINEATRLHGDS